MQEKKCNHAAKNICKMAQNARKKCVCIFSPALDDVIDMHAMTKQQTYSFFFFVPWKKDHQKRFESKSSTSIETIRSAKKKFDIDSIPFIALLLSPYKNKTHDMVLRGARQPGRGACGPRQPAPRIIVCSELWYGCVRGWILSRQQDSYLMPGGRAGGVGSHVRAGMAPVFIKAPWRVFFPQCFPPKTSGSKTQFFFAGRLHKNILVEKKSVFVLVFFPKEKMFFLFHKKKTCMTCSSMLLLTLDCPPNGQQLLLPPARFALLFSARNVKAKD